MLKNIIGVVVSASIVAFLYLGPAVVGLIWGFLPHDMIGDLVQPERRAVYDGAWEISDMEREGDMDGALDQVVDVHLPLADTTQEARAGDDQDGAHKAGGGDGTKAAADRLAIPKPGGRKAGRGSGQGPLVSQGNKGANKTGGRAGKTRKKSRHKCPKTYDGIRKRPNGVYEIDRKLVNYYSGSIKHFNELGWSKSNNHGDKKGWLVTGFGCKDPLWHAGMRRRDIILTVNGKKTNNMMQILMLYSKVKAQRRFAVKIRRAGKSMTLNYSVVK